LKTIGYAAQTKGAALKPFHFDRRELRANDVAMEVLYCGICHSDLHMARNDWGWSSYPLVPGHEIVGRVTAVGKDVTKFKVGDNVAVGCMVDSCQHCDQCKKGEEQLCRNGMTQTYGGKDHIDGSTTYGGYSKHLVTRQEFVLRVPDGLDLSRAAPLLCAGITTWSPLKTWGVKAGSRVGVIGLGGLGHMAVKLAHGLDAQVTVISRTADKEKDAKDLGADRLLLSTDKAAMEKAASSFDLIIDTVPVKHDLAPYLPLLDIDATLVIVGHIGMMEAMETIPLLLARRRVSGSPIGGIRETQELLDFCAEKNILPETETVRIDEVDHAFERMEKADVRYRFVIDMGSLSA
jgi:alcohol dehydrogenase (NADP+)